MKNAVKILVIEDETIVSMEIQDRLRALGYHVVGSATTGKEAIRIVAESNPNLVLMDIKLKGEIDGIEAAEYIRSEFGIPVIYLTAYSDEATLERAKITEPFGYLLKPFEERILHSTIEMALHRHNMEKKLKEREEWFATTLKSIGDAVITTDAKGYVTFMNPIAETLTYWKKEEAIGKDLTKVFHIINEKTGQEVENPAKKALQDGKVIGLANHTILINKKGKKIPIDDSAAPIKDDDGNILGAVLIFRDISKQRREDEKKIRLVKKLESINQELQEFAYIVSHDLKAPLRGIGSLVNWISTDYGPKLDKEGKELLSLLNCRVKRMHNLIEGVLQYSRIGRMKEERVEVDLNQLVEEVIDILNPPPHIDIEIENTLPSITCERTRMGQVFQNLLSNAVKYIDKPKGKIKINCSADNGYYKLSVTDNGPGIMEKYNSKIFQIFQTLSPRDDYESTGIGLTLVKKIIEMYGGKVWVESEVGCGSTFYFTVPHKEDAEKA